MLNDAGIQPSQAKVTPNHLVDLVNLLATGTINGKMAKQLLAEAFQSGQMPTEIVKSKGATQMTDEGEITALIRKVLADNADQVEKFKAGNANIKGFLVGQVMKESKGRANPGLVQKILGVELG